ncbi:Protein scarlet [Nymphon striatum]|nr:Protein scarlet [Nymphon striatum]
MRPAKLEEHFKKVHFKRLRDQSLKTKEKSLKTLFKTNTTMQDRGLYASYELSFLLAKNARPHTDGEDLLKPAIDIYLRTMQDNQRATQELTALPLSNDTVRRRIDELGCMFSAIFRSVPVAMMALVPFDYILMITAGIFIQISSVPAFVGWLKILSWFHYSLEAMSIIQWKDIHNITCEDNVELPCLRNGSQVLSFYGFQQENLHWNLSALAILFAAFHILGFFAFALRTYRT